MTKTCFRCKTEKPLTEFYQNQHKKDKLSSDCKDCNKVRVAAWKSKNKEAVRAANFKWAAANREVGRKSARKFYEENKEYCLAYAKARLRKASTKEQHAINQKRIYARLGDAIVCKALGMPVSETPKELIEAKRLHLQIVKKLREIKA